MIRRSQLARIGDRRFSEFLRIGVECSLHARSGSLSLHPGEKSIEFAAQSIELIVLGSVSQTAHVKPLYSASLRNLHIKS